MSDTRPLWQKPLNAFRQGYEDGEAGHNPITESFWLPNEMAAYERGYHRGVWNDEPPKDENR